MADSKITALSDGSPIVTTDEFVIARSGANNKIPGNRFPGLELDYVQRTTSLSVSATTAAGADTVIDGNAISFDGSTIVLIEFFAPLVDSTQFIDFDLWDGSTDLGVIAQLNAVIGPAYGAMRITPSNASHTFHIKVWRGTGSANVDSGAGGAGTRVPAFYRVTVAK